MDYAISKEVGNTVSHLIVGYFFGPICGGILASIWLMTAGFWNSPAMHAHVRKRKTLREKPEFMDDVRRGDNSDRHDSGK